MENGRDAVAEIFGNRVRVRVSGICIKNDRILLVNHRGINDEDEFWAPPGGGFDFGYSAEENLIREFKEETGLNVKVNDFLCVNEFIGAPLHAVELFFVVEAVDGVLQKGSEPELSGRIEIIKSVGFKNWSWVKEQSPAKVHNLLYKATTLKGLLEAEGYFLQKKK